MDKPLSYIEISKENLIHNFQEFKKLVGTKIAISAVIKGNAYGHGQKEITEILEPYVDFFQVDDIEELTIVKTQTKKPTLVLGYVAKGEIRRALKLGSILAVYDIGHLEIINQEAAKLGIKTDVHVKIDANLGRQGILLENLKHFLIQAKRFENIQISGIYTHFANIEDTTDSSHALLQISTFRKALDICDELGLKNIKKHLSATSGVLFNKKLLNNEIVRLGIGLYGMWPSLELEHKNGNSINLRPVIRWISHVAQIKVLPKDYTVGYGLTYRTISPTKIAIVPQGYSDGYDRGLSNCGEVLIQGKRCPVIGRVAMNMFAVNVSKIKNIEPEDEVVLLGKQGDDAITAEEIAKKIGTINYEVVTRITPLLSRIVV